MTISRGPIRSARAKLPGRLGQAVAVVDEGEPAPVEGQEKGIVPVDGQVEVGLDAVGGEKAGRLGPGGEVGVEAEDDVGGGARALELQAGEERGAVADADEVQLGSRRPPRTPRSRRGRGPSG
jgi:hypothetical protein